jgi:hypothetical protein
VTQIVERLGNVTSRIVIHSSFIHPPLMERARSNSSRRPSVRRQALEGPRLSHDVVRAIYELRLAVPAGADASFLSEYSPCESPDCVGKGVGLLGIGDMPAVGELDEFGRRR